MSSILKSTVNPNKKDWMDKLSTTLGKDYLVLHSTSLVAIHLCVLIHKRLLPLVKDLKVSQIATGVMNTIGNKGGVGISFKVGDTSLLFVNCHLSSG